MKDNSRPAFPNEIYQSVKEGLSEHKLISAMCLQGILSNANDSTISYCAEVLGIDPKDYVSKRDYSKVMAMEAYNQATALLKLYDEEKEK